MKIKKILSTALTVIMIFMAVVAVLPITAVKSEAAYSPSSNAGQSSLNSDEIEAYIKEYLNYNFATYEQMLNHEISLGYLYSSTSADGMYTIYVNRYTGMLYYRNNYTGQILTSNPSDIGYKQLTDGPKYDVMSQVSVTLYETANEQGTKVTYTSVEWAAAYGQISVTPIAGGLRVNYTLGDTSSRFLLPGMIAADDFTTDILYPIVRAFEELLAEYMPELGDSYNFIGNPLYDTTEELGYAGFDGVDAYNMDMTALINQHNNAAEASELSSVLQDFVNMANTYVIYDPNDELTFSSAEIYKEKYPLYAEGRAVAAVDLDPNKLALAKQRAREEVIKKYCPDYNLTMMFEDEKESGYVHKTVNKPYVRCAIEYSFNDDGSLCVRVPANSISFDESIYTLESLSVLKYFGASNITDEGFIFFPDGSGTVIDYEDFYDPSIGKAIPFNGAADSIYGIDYCYSSIKGAHRQQVTMPVYGVVGQITPTETTAEALKYRGVEVGDTISSGYFAILEEGASLAKLNFFSNVSIHKYGNAYSSYTPYPSDKYDLSQTLSVGSATFYTMVAKTKYSGSYVTRITMLYDEAVGDALYGEDNYCDTTYVGMASYYRNYLKENGVLTALEALEEDIPLYIEVLGSMTITTKVLTFPVEEEIPLTTFDDVITMYNELATARKKVKSLIDENLKLAEEEENDLVKAEYLSYVEKYEKMLTQIENVKNVNFRLTGFANDGMYYTYPAKVDWQDVLGGDFAFENLVSESKRITAVEGQTFGIYPEFDFLYITNTALFDGVSQSEIGSRMVDNRYASKQVYNAILQEFETFYTMVVSSDALDSLYTKFNKDYSKFEPTGLSVSTLGSDINSNFDRDNSINRDEARENIVALLQRMNVVDGYDLMVDKGNIYSVQYASHILNVPTDSSHFKYSSYTIPFVGMILHSYVNYTGAPINYSGSTAYEILRSIESGAAPYYILCYQNTAHLKEDEVLNTYYGVDYETWYDDILLAYADLNSLIGDLQTYEITAHKAVIAERVKEDSELLADYAKLEAEYFELLAATVDKAVEEKYDELRAEGDLTSRVVVELDVRDITAQFRVIAAEAGLIFNGTTFSEKLTALAELYAAEYPGDTEDGDNNAAVFVDEVEDYASQYSFHTESECTEDDDTYVFTNYTLDNNKVMIVTYQNGEDTVRFILNYNIYSVTVRLDGVEYTLGKYGYVRIDG